MVKLSVIFTGGTIGSVADGVVKNDDNRYKLIKLYNTKYGQRDFVLYNPYTVLSENISADNLVLLKKTITEAAKQSDGIIVTHGTDTLAYTANYLSITLHSLAVPVVMVASNYPLEDERGHGLINFAAAVEFIEDNKIGKGVFVAFKNDGENVKIHLGNRLIQSRQIDGYIDSIDGKVAELVNAKSINATDKAINSTNTNSINATDKTAEFNENKFRYYGVKNGDYAANILPQEIIEGELFGKVALIKLHALIDFDLYDFELSHPDAVVVELYHSGTVNTSRGGHFVNFVQRCNKLNIPVITAAAPLNGNVYEGTDKLLRLSNLTYTHGLTVENVLIKTILACGSRENKQELLGKIFGSNKAEQ